MEMKVIRVVDGEVLVLSVNFLNVEIIEDDFFQ